MTIKWTEDLLGPLHGLCVRAVNRMVAEGITHHVSFISGEDDITFALPSGRIPKVTIEWVDAAEAEPQTAAAETG